MLLIMRGLVRENPDKGTLVRSISGRKGGLKHNSTEPRGPAHSPAFLGSIDPFARQNESHRYASEARASQQNARDRSRQFSHPQKSFWLFAHWCDPAPR